MLCTSRAIVKAIRDSYRLSRKVKLDYPLQDVRCSCKGRRVHWSPIRTKGMLWYGITSEMLEDLYVHTISSQESFFFLALRMTYCYANVHNAKAKLRTSVRHWGHDLATSVVATFSGRWCAGVTVRG